MTAQPPQKSRWGSLLSGAVAGLESRLDNILAEEGSAPAKNAEVERRREEARKERATSSDLQRSSSSASNNAQNQNAFLKPSEQDRAQTQSPQLQIPRISLDSTASDPSRLGITDNDSKPASEQDSGEQGRNGLGTHDISGRPSLDKSETSNDEQLLPNIPVINAVAEQSVRPEEALAELRDHVAQIETDNDEAESKHHEEVQGYLERIDALQAKLQYLAQEAAKTAKQAATDAADNSLEKKLAAKDEQIALLLEEGTKLSKADVTQASTIRRMRLKMNEDSKAQAEARRVLQRAEVASSGLQDRIAQVEAEKKDALSKLTRMARLEKELGDARRERGTKDATIHDLQSQLAAAKKQADEDTRIAAEKALEQERKVSQSLRDDLANLKIEQTLRDDRAKQQLKDAQDGMQHERERLSGVQMGLRNEIAMLETRLEVVRERSEEASSGTTSDSHTKLMRQVETLQSQYAVASENWQILESSLQSRLAGLERERDEASQAETDARKKARENGSTARRLQEQLDGVNQRCQVLEHELADQRRLTERLETRAIEAEKLVSDERQKNQDDRNAWDTKLQARLDEEKAKWQSQSAKTTNMAPSLLTMGSLREPGYRKKSGIDLPGLGSRRLPSRQTSDFGFTAFERPGGQRTSTFTSQNSTAESPNGAESGVSTPGFDANNNLESPSIHTVDQDDVSPHRTMNEMLSVATTSAGPSVQLVERMSAAVRRLESEKAASKDELSRLSSQRDDARTEVVNLMREVEEKRSLEAKVDKLEKNLSETSQRYATTLEMLGEKSERVEELQADVDDLKKIYRELIESTLK